MKSKEKMIPESEAVDRIQLALRRAALLYRFFAKTLSAGQWDRP